MASLAGQRLRIEPACLGELLFEIPTALPGEAGARLAYAPGAIRAGPVAYARRPTRRGSGSLARRRRRRGGPKPADALRFRRARAGALKPRKLSTLPIEAAALEALGPRRRGGNGPGMRSPPAPAMPRWPTRACAPRAARTQELVARSESQAGPSSGCPRTRRRAVRCRRWCATGRTRWPARRATSRFRRPGDRPPRD